MKTILVIDDDSLLRKTVQSALLARGYQTLVAEDGESGLRLAQEYLPDLILSDVYMGDSDAYMILAALRKELATSTIPVILMTGKADPEGLRRSMELGADDYLEKPFSLEQLMGALKARLKKHESIRLQAHQAKARLLAIIEATPDLVAMTDLDYGKVTYLNRAGRDLLGLAATASLSTLNLLKSHPAWAQRRILNEGLPAAIRGGTWIGETALPGKDGRLCPLSELILACPATEEEEGYLSIIARDITASKQAEERLRRSQELYRIITENAADLIAVVDAHGHRLYNSPSYQTVLGYSVAELQLASAFEQIHPDDRPAVIAAAKKTFDTGVGQVIEYRMRHKNGTWLTLESHGGIIRDSEGRVENLLLVARDITERKGVERERERMEVQLRHAQKLESIGQLAAGIAHEINSPIQYVGDNTRFLQDAYGDLVRLLNAFEDLTTSLQAGGQDVSDRLKDAQTLSGEIDAAYLLSEIPKAIEQSLEGIGRITKIVQAMKEFSHPGTTTKSPVDLNQAIQSTLTVARNEYKYVADVQLNLDPSLPPVPGLPAEINQVILNLLINASHAIADGIQKGKPGKGTITIRTRTSKKWAEFDISDTGPGIPEDIRNRIFEPFFTTKPVGKGTGQGLSICHSVVVDKHLGQIEFESEVGKGTRFTVRLPLKSNPPRKPSPPPPSDAPPSCYTRTQA